MTYYTYGGWSRNGRAIGCQGETFKDRDMAADPVFKPVIETAVPEPTDAACPECKERNMVGNDNCHFCGKVPKEKKIMTISISEWLTRDEDGDFNVYTDKIFKELFILVERI